MKKIRFDIKDLLPIGLTIVILGIGLAYGLNVMGDIKDDMGESSCAARTDDFVAYNASKGQCYNATTNTHANVLTADYNASADAISGVAKIPEKLPLIVTVIVAAVIIGILVRYLMVRYN